MLHHALVVASLLASATAYSYSVGVVQFDETPLLSSVMGNSAFQQVFNPSWVANSSAQPKTGLLVRSQNCSVGVGGACIHCGGSGAEASVITFAPLVSSSADGVVFGNITVGSVVFGPGNGTFDDFGTEDPRLALDTATGTYYMFYTSYGSGSGQGNSVLLSLASTVDPTTAEGWTRHGAVFPGVQGSKSGALLVRPSAPHFLLWGDTSIRITSSSDPAVWAEQGQVLLAPRPGMFDSTLVESGPPPLLLSTGDYLFLHNSADANLTYHPSWAILSGADPSVVLARASAPLLSPTEPWEKGVTPWTCNVGNVVFLEGAQATDQPDVFRIYFGGSDAVVATAIIAVKTS